MQIIRIANSSEIISVAIKVTILPIPFPNRAATTPRPICIDKAEANAKIAVAKAEGEAKAMKIKADAEAYYNRTIAASLSKLIIQEDWIEKWDGKLPQVQGGDQMMPVVNFNNSKD